MSETWPHVAPSPPPPADTATSVAADGGTDLVWLFAYGSSTNTHNLSRQIPGWERRIPALLADHLYIFTKAQKTSVHGRSSLAHLPGSYVLGVAYLISAASLSSLCEVWATHALRTHVITANGHRFPAHAFERTGADQRCAPDTAYLDEVQEGLRSVYQRGTVERYLARSVRQSTGGLPAIATMETKPFVSELGVEFRRLFPWDATRFDSFGAGVARIQPGESSGVDSHYEEETFLVLSGVGSLHSDGQVTSLRKGDLVYVPPFATHSLENTGASTLEVLCLWFPDKPPDGADPTTVKPDGNGGRD